MPILSNSKYELFAQAIAQGMSASAAYVAAGYVAHGPNAARLRKHEQVQARIDELMSEGAREAGVTIASIVAELAKIGFSDLRKAVRWKADEDGNHVMLVDSDKVDDATAAALAEISQTKEGALKVKLHDKLGALEKLGKHLGMFKDPDMNATITVNLTPTQAEY